ncbi:unnamed protein product [Cylindrotheca closterium]|uniref:Uncharacterized protein n=1 Tax=Cylindrotheca closterium TaxID=2856 RepID=A0AAD2FLN5_9STRA|nr:unnamed protein product [Cylindrotheca closterium]
MFITAVAQSITKKSPQQAARIQQATRTITTDSFAFYPVRKTRYDQIVPTSMFQANTQAAIKKAPQQVARIHSPAGQSAPAESHSFAFHPVQKNRVRTVTPKTNRVCYGFYPANVEKTQSFKSSASIKDVKAMRAALKQKKQTKKVVKQNWDLVMQEMRAVKKTINVLP